MNDNDKTTVSAVISSKYSQIKKVLNCEWVKTHTTPFDEDLFHDTLYKCINKMENKLQTEGEIFNYIFVAFKYNVIRESMYHRNSMKVDAEISYIGEYNQIFNMDYDLITNGIKEKFGIELYEAFSEWVSGKSITKITAETKIDNLYYKFKKIKEWVKSEYKL